MVLNQRKINLKYLILNGNFPPDTERIICKNIQQETEIIRIPDIENISKENIESSTKQLTKIG
jgi:dethiobiotin synthetase